MFKEFLAKAAGSRLLIPNFQMLRTSGEYRGRVQALAKILREECFL